MMRTRILILALAISSATSLRADWMPFIINYGKADYGSGASTWRIATHGGWTFFANQRGMLVFDGVSWTRYELHNHSEARSVAIFPKSQCLFLGGENEYGYFNIGPSGNLEYTCASDRLGPELRNIGNVFDIYEQNGTFFLRGDNNILEWSNDGRNIFRIYSPDKIFCSTLSGGVIYVATTQGVKMVAGHQLMPVPGTEVLNGLRINGIFGFDSGLMIATDTEGLYYYDGHTTRPYPTPADHLLRQGMVCRAEYQNGKIAIGTNHQGLVVIDTKTGQVRQFDEQRGLQSNTVLSVAFDERGNIWAGLDYGIDYILLEDPFSYLYRSPHSFGIGYSALRQADQIYFGTDRGFFRSLWPVGYDGGTPRLTQVEGSPQGPAWFLYDYEGQLLCMHDKGVYRVMGQQAQRIMPEISGAWSCRAVEGRRGLLFIGVYDGIYLAAYADGQWTCRGRIEGIEGSGRHFRQTGPMELKVYNAAQGTAVVYKLNAALTKVVGRQELSEPYRDEGMQHVDRLFTDWDVTGPILHMPHQEIIPYDKGFVMLNQQKVRDDVAVRIAIRRMYTTFPKDSAVYYSNFSGIKTEPVLDYAHNAVCFDFNVPVQWLAQPAKVQYRLNGGPWSEPASIGSKEYSNLQEGRYVFEVRGSLYDGHQYSDSITFRILPPWYRSWWAYSLYALLALAALWLLWLLERRRMHRKQQQAVRDKDKVVDQMKNEIDKLERDNVELDLRHKNQEIANMAINVARKNEILADLRERIRTVTTRMDRSNVPDSKRELLLIMGSIDQNMEGDEVLRRFEEQFDLVNDNFMKRLCQRHPDLSSNERLMCAYLKMNLSTKEIAPLLNISVRGVETMRYRLRKKLGLERENSLLDYFEKFL